MKFRLLKADEIDCRIAQINTKYVTLLLYKDARVDMNILDETVGAMNWKREHKRDNANCVVSIWDEDKVQWIDKEDTGKESYTEAEKGLASDSFKRACFNWGIGRELYSAPKIQFLTSKANVKDGKCYDKFYVEKIAYDENNNICELSIINNSTGVRVFDMNGIEKNNVDDLVEQKADAKCSDKQWKYLKVLINNSNEDESKYLDMYHIKALSELTATQASALISKLK